MNNGDILLCALRVIAGGLLALGIFLHRASAQ